MRNDIFVQELLNNVCPDMVMSNSHSKWNYACISLHCKFIHIVWTYLNNSGVPNIYHVEVTQNATTPEWVLGTCNWD